MTAAKSQIEDGGILDRKSAVSLPAPMVSAADNHEMLVQIEELESGVTSEPPRICEFESLDMELLV